jgi:hypothetical protein
MNFSIEKQRKEFKKIRRVYGDPGNLKIKGFIPLNEDPKPNHIRRFTKIYNLKLPCPKCGSFDDVYEDNWPPNYHSGSGSINTGSSGVSILDTPPFSIKHICTKCRIQFIVVKADSREEKFKDNIKVSFIFTESQMITMVKPLHLIYNFYMTDSDYDDEMFYNENGHYQFMVYG